MKVNQICSYRAEDILKKRDTETGPFEQYIKSAAQNDKKSKEKQNITDVFQLYEQGKNRRIDIERCDKMAETEETVKFNAEVSTRFEKDCYLTKLWKEGAITSTQWVWGTLDFNEISEKEYYKETLNIKNYMKEMAQEGLKRGGTSFYQEMEKVLEHL